MGRIIHAARPSRQPRALGPALAVVSMAAAALLGGAARRPAAFAAGGALPLRAPSRPVRVEAGASDEWEVNQKFGASGVQKTYAATPENAEIVLEECREALSQCFGYTEENQKVGITGKVNFVELQGPFMIIAFDEGNFWHKRSDVLKRVEVCIIDRMPELAQVDIEDEQMLVDTRRGSDDGPPLRP